MQPFESHRVAHPEDWLQVSVGLLHTTGAPPHTPARQTSPVVQLLPSLHDVPSAALMIAGHWGGPPPFSQLWDASTWQADCGKAQVTLWQISGPPGLERFCALAALNILAQAERMSTTRAERRDMACLPRIGGLIRAIASLLSNT